MAARLELVQWLSAVMVSSRSARARSIEKPSRTTMRSTAMSVAFSGIV